MQKIKLSLLVLMIMPIFWVKPVIAATVSIVDLPDYVNTNNFKLSCSSLGGSSAQFSFRKEGGSYADFGSAIDLTSATCQIQVTSSQVNDQTTYYFKVTVDGTDSDETSTFYDISGPSPVSNYYKEQVGTGFYKLHWRNPGDSDFDKVIIYRGETADFPADNSHEIARVSGGANSEMTYDENQPDPNKTYFYLIRAIDRANNSSSLVGDAGTTTVTTGSIAGTSTGTTGSGSQLPLQGQVLGEDQAVAEESPSPSPSGIATTGLVGDLGGFFQTVQGKIAAIAAFVFIAIGYFYWKRKK